MQLGQEHHLEIDPLGRADLLELQEGLLAVLPAFGGTLAAEDELAESGRIVLRASGTEPVIRVMVEGQDEQQVNSVAERLAAVVAEAAR